MPCSEGSRDPWPRPSHEVALQETASGDQGPGGATQPQKAGWHQWFRSPVPIPASQLSRWAASGKGLPPLSLLPLYRGNVRMEAVPGNPAQCRDGTPSPKSGVCFSLAPGLRESPTRAAGSVAQSISYSPLLPVMVAKSDKESTGDRDGDTEICYLLFHRAAGCLGTWGRRVLGCSDP